MKSADDEPERIPGPQGLENLKAFARHIFTMPKSAIAEKLRKPIYRPRKRVKAKRKRKRTQIAK
jgi:hypothetical protein